MSHGFSAVKEQGLDGFARGFCAAGFAVHLLWLVLVAAEEINATSGLGYLIIQSTESYRTDRLYAINIVGAALARTAYLACRLWEAWLFRWKAEVPATP